MLSNIENISGILARMKRILNRLLKNVGLKPESRPPFQAEKLFVFRPMLGQCLGPVYISYSRNDHARNSKTQNTTKYVSFCLLPELEEFINAVIYSRFVTLKILV